MTYLDEANKLKEETIARRRDFHQYPELGLKETRTAGIVAEVLNGLGLEVTTGIGETGVVGLLHGAAESPVLLLRFDMDALPIQEENDVPYASKNPGRMHACGHDSHVAVGLSVARILAARRDTLPGTIKFVFQPAEEGAGGAARMVADGVLEAPRPDYAMAMHVWNERPVGWYGLTRGPAMAGAHTFTIRVKGRGGHGAAPHHCADPIVAGAHIITALQTIVSRNISPLDTAVISACKLESGSAFNIIPQEATISGTIRTFKQDVFELLESRFKTLVHHLATAMDCEAEISIQRVTYPVANDTKLTEVMAEVVEEVDSQARVVFDHRTMGAEDFSFMMADIPGCFMFVGSANPEKGLDYPHHHPRFDIDEDCLPYAVAILARGAMEILSRNPE